MGQPTQTLIYRATRIFAISTVLFLSFPQCCAADAAQSSSSEPVAAESEPVDGNSGVEFPSQQSSAQAFVPPAPKTIAELDRLRHEVSSASARREQSSLVLKEQAQLLKQAEDTLTRLRQLSTPDSDLQAAAHTLELRRAALDEARLTVESQSQRLEALSSQLADQKNRILLTEAEYRALTESLTRSITRFQEELKGAENVLSNAREELLKAQNAAKELDTSTDSLTQDMLVARQAAVEQAQELVSGYSRLLAFYRDAVEVWRSRYEFYSGSANRGEQRELLKHVLEQRTTLETALGYVRLTLEELRSKESAITTELDSDTLDGNSRANSLRLRRSLSQRSDFLRSQLKLLEPLIPLYQGVTEELREHSSKYALANISSTLLASLAAFWNFELSISDGQPITVGKVFVAIVLFILGYYLSRRLVGIFGRRLEANSHLAPGVVAAIKTLSFYGLIAVFALVALHLVKIPLTAFAFVGGALAVGVGFGSQHLVNNFISGLMLLIERPIRVGDVIEVGGGRGTVTRIGPRSVTLRTVESTEIIVPNSTLLEKNLVNATFSDPKVRLGVRVSVAYNSDPEIVRSELKRAALDHPLVLSSPDPQVFFADFGESGLVFDLFVWVFLREGASAPQVQSDLRFAIVRHFKEKEIAIPFPQREVRILS